MQQNLFEISDYRVLENSIEVDVCNILDNPEETKLEIEVSIDKHFFVKFLEDNNKLEWLVNGVDNTGEYKESTGTMTEEEYFQETLIKFVNQDIYDFIVSNPIVFRKNTYQNSVESILKQFNKNK